MCENYITCFESTLSPDLEYPDLSNGLVPYQSQTSQILSLFLWTEYQSLCGEVFLTVH